MTRVIHAIVLFLATSSLCYAGCSKAPRTLDHQHRRSSVFEEMAVSVRGNLQETPEAHGPARYEAIERFAQRQQHISALWMKVQQCIKLLDSLTRNNNARPKAERAAPLDQGQREEEVQEEESDDEELQVVFHRQLLADKSSGKYRPPEAIDEGEESRYSAITTDR